LDTPKVKVILLFLSFALTQDEKRKKKHQAELALNMVTYACILNEDKKNRKRTRLFPQQQQQEY